MSMGVDRPYGGVGGDEFMMMMMGRKKRGRPRKYGPDGSMALGLSPGFASPPTLLDFSAKRGRGRPPGSGKRQLLTALGGWVASSAGGNFTPHVVTVAAGEDVATRILSFSQKGPRSICILSANGAISNVTLRQPGSSGGTLTYEVEELKLIIHFGILLKQISSKKEKGKEKLKESSKAAVVDGSLVKSDVLLTTLKLTEGVPIKSKIVGLSGGQTTKFVVTFEQKLGRFEILSLSGSFTLSESGGIRSRTGGISVSLAGPDGRVVGGGVAGLLMAASPIQVVVGSFMPNSYKEPKRKHNPESSMFTTVPTTAGIVTAARPISQATPDEDTCTTPSSQLPGQSQGDPENSAENNHNPVSTSFHSVSWHGPQSVSGQRPSPDINISLPVE
ncbi:hypothetical protein ACLOJK_020773 [Asimina triloba]